MPYIQPENQALEALLKLEDGSPVVMLNMLRFRETAAYPESSAHTPCSGREAYARYAQKAIEHVHAVGGHTVWLGEVQMTLVGPHDEPWDEVILMQYPSRAAFMKMATNPDYLNCVVHRTAALADSRLIAIRG
jgi:uncharacterized protein (DUF1330 family)